MTCCAESKAKLRDFLRRGGIIEKVPAHRNPRSHLERWASRRMQSRNYRTLLNETRRVRRANDMAEDVPIAKLQKHFA